MINNIQDFAAYFGSNTPIELSRALWKHDSYVSSATFTTASGETFTTYPDFYSLDDFPQGVVSVVFNATKEGSDYEPSMTPLVFPFEDFEIQEAITYLDGELYGSQSDSQHQPDKLIETIADAQEFVASKYQQHSTDTVFKPYTKKSKLNAVSFEDSEGFETIVEIPCTPNSLELALLLAWGE
jgi:hypothetical protein